MAELTICNALPRRKHTVQTMCMSSAKQASLQASGANVRVEVALLRHALVIGLTASHASISLNRGWSAARCSRTSAGAWPSTCSIWFLLSRPSQATMSSRKGSRLPAAGYAHSMPHKWGAQQECNAASFASCLGSVLLMVSPGLTVLPAGSHALCSYDVQLSLSR